MEYFFGQSHWTTIIHQGLCGLSACLKQEGYKEVHLLDIRKLKNWEESEYKFINIKPDMVFLIMRSCDTLIDLKIAKRFKKINSNVKIIVGGIHISI